MIWALREIRVCTGAGLQCVEQPLFELLALYHQKTNRTLAELKEWKNVAQALIYDRILERCVPVQFSGRNYRTENAENTKNSIREILTQEDNL